MELPRTVEWALHTAWLLAQSPDGAALPRRRIAEFYDLPEPYLAKLLGKLTDAGVLTAVTGPGGGYRLARLASDLTALEVVLAVEGSKAMFHCQEIRQRGPVGLAPEKCRKACGIASLMYDAERAWRDRLATTSVADLVTGSGPPSSSRARRWFHDLAR